MSAFLGGQFCLIIWKQADNLASWSWISALVMGNPANNASVPRGEETNTITLLTIMRASTPDRTHDSLLATEAATPREKRVNPRLANTTRAGKKFSTCP